MLPSIHLSAMKSNDILDSKHFFGKVSTLMENNYYSLVMYMCMIMISLWVCDLLNFNSQDQNNGGVNV